MKTILFLNENPLPPVFTKGTIAAKELRLRAAICELDFVHVIARSGPTMVKPGRQSQIQGELEKKIIVHLLPPWPYYLAAIPLFIWGVYYCIKLKPVAIEAESPLIAGPAAVLLSKLFQIPSIIEVRSTFHQLALHRFPWLPQKIKLLLIDAFYWPTLKSATAIIANSSYYHKFLKKNGLTSTIINPGLQYPPNYLPKKKLPRHIKIGYIGRLVPEKSVDILIAAFALLLKENPRQKISLEIAGTGPAQVNLQTLVHQLRLDPYVKFMGFADNYTILRTWHVAVNPITVLTPLEMVNAEAAYVGTPMICFGNQEYPETVKHLYSGIKIPTPDATLLSQALSELISHPDQLLKLSQTAHEFAKQNYQMTDQIKKLIQLYRDLSVINRADFRLPQS